MTHIFVCNDILSVKMHTFATQKQSPGLSPAPFRVREESPGSIGHPTSENGSCWRRQARAEENNRPTSCGVRVRRWCKRPPADG